MSGITRFRLDCAETAIKVTVEVNWVSKMRIYIILLHLITIAQIRVKQFRRGAEAKCCVLMFVDCMVVILPVVKLPCDGWGRMHLLQLASFQAFSGSSF